MRIVNDKKDEQAPPAELGFFALLSHAFFSALGFVTLALSPAPSILAETRLNDPWPKVSALLGAVIALVFLQVSLPVLIIAFTISVFVGAAVNQETKFHALMAQLVLLALVVGALALGVSSQLNGRGYIEEWQLAIGLIVGQFQMAFNLQPEQSSDILTQLRTMLLRQGPFLYLSAVMLTAWFSIGFASHMGWLAKNTRYNADALRALRFPSWVSYSYLFLLVATRYGLETKVEFVGGLYSIVSALMIIQGMIIFSSLLKGRVSSQIIRGMLYTTSVFLGFYLLMGLGAVAPFFFRRSRNQTTLISKPDREEVV